MAIHLVHHFFSSVKVSRKSWDLFTATLHESVGALMSFARVSPRLEHAAYVWNLHLAKDINSLGPQRFALGICSKNYNSSNEDLLDLFQIPSL